MRLPTRAVVLAALVAVPPVLSARQEPARSPRNASYTMAATLDPAARLLTGQGRLSWRNTSSEAATELRFHMYWNAWRDNDSTWMRERRLARNQPAPAGPSGSPGSIDLTVLSVVTPSGPRDVLPLATYIAPDDGNAADRTLLAVPLEQPIAPGATVEIDLGWTARVPLPVARTGATGDYFFIAHWFPKIGVLADDGWRARQFHAATEFFADFGTYDVRLTVPSGWVVAATGRRQAITDNGDGRTTHRFVEHDVHDFAWVTSPDLVEVRDRFEQPGLPAVELELLLQPEHRAQADRHFEAARAALAAFGAWFGPYPYAELTIVDPLAILDPDVQGSGTGGMEYPTLLTTGTRWNSPWRTAAPESVTIHEVGHQFWHGIVATSEFDHAWMDEGLTTFASARVLAESFPGRFVATRRYFGGLVAWTYDDVPWTRDVDGNLLAAYRTAATWDTPAMPSWRYWPGAATATTYAKTALWLTALERHLGWETLQRGLATYFSRAAFRHPEPAELFAAISDASGRDLQWFFDAVHGSSATFDYAVAQVTQAEGDGAVLIRRLGDGVFPVDVRVTFGDGRVVTERWEGRERWRLFSYPGAGRIETVAIDPDRVLTLDLDYTNNSWTSRPRGGEAASKWALRWLTWAQHVLLTYAFFV